MSDYKTTLTPEEWYGFKRTHPKEYRIIKNHIRDANWYPPIRYGGIQFVELVVPRRWFDFGLMLDFLTKHRHLGEYEFIAYKERPHYRGGTYTTRSPRAPDARSPCTFAGSRDPLRVLGRQIGHHQATGWVTRLRAVPTRLTSPAATALTRPSLSAITRSSPGSTAAETSTSASPSSRTATLSPGPRAASVTPQIGASAGALPGGATRRSSAVVITTRCSSTPAAGAFLWTT